MRHLVYDNWTSFFQDARHNSIKQYIKDNTKRYFEVRIGYKEKIIFELTRNSLDIVQLKIRQYDDINQFLNIYKKPMYFQNDIQEDKLNKKQITELTQVMKYIMNFVNCDGMYDFM
jgi:hypothetical protein